MAISRLQAKKGEIPMENKTNPYDPRFEVTELINPRDCDNRLILAMYPYTLRGEKKLYQRSGNTYATYRCTAKAYMGFTKICDTGRNQSAEKKYGAVKK